MILDNALTLVTPTITAAGNYDAVDQIDLSSLRDLSEGHEIKALLTVTTTFLTGTSIDFQLIGADTSGGGSSNFLLSWSGAITTANLTAGTQRIITLPKRVVANTPWGTRYQRFLIFRAVAVAASNFTAGAASMSLILDEQDGRTFYPSGFSIT
jgi:hypothetical protein